MVRAIWLSAALGLFLAPAAAYKLALPVSAAARQPQPAACSKSGRAARVCSIGMMQNLDGTGSFRTVQEYPCDLDVKIIGDNEGPFVSDMVTLCAERTGQKEADVGVTAWSISSSRQRQSRPPRLEAPSRLRMATLWLSRSELRPLEADQPWSLSEAPPKTLVSCPCRCKMARQRQVPRDHAAAAL